MKKAVYLACSLAFTLLASTQHVHASTWPSKSIKLVTPGTPGGPPDAYARALADHLAQALKQPVVVENAPAIGGMVAAQALLRTPADGYTLFVSTAGVMAITPAANPLAKYVPNDFTHICQGVDTSFVLASHPSVPAKDLSSLKQWLKEHKQPATYSSFGPGTPAHFLGYQFSEAIGVDMTHVPYRSSPLQITDMLGGTSPFGFVQIATSSPHIKAEKLKAYATTGPTRAPELPEVPTVKELGLPELETTVWFGLAAPKNLPQDIRQKLEQVHEQILQQDSFKQRMQTALLNPTPGVCGEQFVNKMNHELQRWQGVVQKTGFIAD